MYLLALHYQYMVQACQFEVLKTRDYTLNYQLFELKGVNY